MKNFDETRGFGVELEILVPRTWGQTGFANKVAAMAGVNCAFAGYTHAVTDYWKVVTDASLRAEAGWMALELVSPILRGKAGLDAVARVCNALTEMGAKVNVSCGLHVHHDARDLTLDAWKNLCKLFGKHERALHQVLPPSRRNSRWCMPINNEPTLADFFKKIDAGNTIEQVARTVSGRSRYRTLNTESYWRHGSVEFRQHGGTVDADKVVNWIKLTAAFVNVATYTKRVVAKGHDSFKVIGSMIDAKAARYFEERRAHFGFAAAA